VNPVAQACFTLGALRDPRTLDALRAVAELRTRLQRAPGAHTMAQHAIQAPAKFDTPALAPMWIQLRDGKLDLPAERLGKLGDRRAMAPLRADAVNSGHIAAAKALAELGDDDAMRRLRWDMLRSMGPDDEST